VTPLLLGGAWPARATAQPQIRFSLQPLPFRLETDETLATPHAPATMAGGVAVFDYNKDGRPDIFFTNGANIATLKKDSPKYSNRLFRNEGKGVFKDVTKEAGLAGTGYDMGAAVGDYDNNGYPDLFVTGVHGRKLYHNNGDGTFADITEKAGLGGWNDPEFGPLWSVAAAWVDVNNDGLLDLFVVNYVQWDYATEHLCGFVDRFDYCSPNFYKGLPNQLYLNKGNGRFEDVSEKWGLRKHVGKGMGVGVADYDLDGRPDLFVTNDLYYNYLFHNSGSKFEEVAFDEGVALVEDGQFISGMGVDFRDIDNDGYPDITTVGLNNQTFPVWRNIQGKGFEEITHPSGIREASLRMGGFGVGFITLLGASIALMNIMLVSVTERTREVGVRKALGATPLRIRQQFVIEAIVVCVLGGIVGVLLGISLGNVLSRFVFKIDAFVMPWFWITLGMIVCIVVGLLSGYYPAHKASKLDPIESLRFE